MKSLNSLPRGDKIISKTLIPSLKVKTANLRGELGFGRILMIGAEVRRAIVGRISEGGLELSKGNEEPRISRGSWMWWRPFAEVGMNKSVPLALQTVE